MELIRSAKPHLAISWRDLSSLKTLCASHNNARIALHQLAIEEFIVQPQFQKSSYWQKRITEHHADNGAKITLNEIIAYMKGDHDEPGLFGRKKQLTGNATKQVLKEKYGFDFNPRQSDSDSCMDLLCRLCAKHSPAAPAPTPTRGM